MQSLNWRPEAMVQALQLIAMSINNVVSFLRILSGLPGSRQRFLNPSELGFFEAPWQWSTGAFSLALAIPVAETDIRRLSEHEILEATTRLLSA
jgi:hypothetical protein